ncbi:hypothetical protein P9112_004835 [Eukaryota sp. TZLM1-RC]
MQDFNVSQQFHIKPISRKAYSLSLPDNTSHVPRTTRAGLVLCLHIGFEPPDDCWVDGQPRAVMECFLNPATLPLASANSFVAKELRTQFKQIKLSESSLECAVDLVVENIHAFCTNLRRLHPTEQYDDSRRSHIHTDRVLFYYNGHGVPRPTSTELWFLNKHHTKYMPAKIDHIAKYIGNPATYILDCSNAGELVPFLSNLPDVYVFSATSEGQLLPIDPNLPADLFTSCLTAPIETCLSWYATRSHLSEVNYSVVSKLKRFNSGQVNDKKTILGELHSIFTAITDAICWNLLPPLLFRKLLRQDNPTAYLFRHFLLADRLFGYLGVKPLSVPKLPPTSHHFLWLSWDRTLDLFMRSIVFNHEGQIQSVDRPCFFSEQLKAFSHYVSFRPSAPPSSSVYHLPILLQAVIGQSHRDLAVELLAKFIDFGSWAAESLLEVGFVTYLRKLVDNKYFKQEFVHLWAKLMLYARPRLIAVIEGKNSRSSMDLKLFVALVCTSPNYRIKALACFVVAQFIDSNPQCLLKSLSMSRAQKLIDLLIDVGENFREVDDSDFNLFLQWLCLCVYQIFSKYNSQISCTEAVVISLSNIQLISSCHLVRSTCFAALRSVFCYFARFKALSNELITALLETCNSFCSDCSFVVRTEAFLFILNLIEKTVIQTNDYSLQLIPIVNILLYATFDPDLSVSFFFCNQILELRDKLSAVLSSRSRELEASLNEVFSQTEARVEHFGLRHPLIYSDKPDSKSNKYKKSRKTSDPLSVEPTVCDIPEVSGIQSILTDLFNDVTVDGKITSPTDSVDQMKLNIRNQSIMESTSRDNDHISNPIGFNVGVLQLLYPNSTNFSIQKLLFHPFDLTTIAVDPQGLAVLQSWNPNNNKEFPNGYFTAVPFGHCEFHGSQVCDAFLTDSKFSDGSLVSSTSDGAIFISKLPSLEEGNSFDKSLISGFRPVKNSKYWSSLGDTSLCSLSFHRIANSPDGSLVSSMGIGQNLSIIDLSSLTIRESFDLDPNTDPCALTWLDDNFIVLGSSDGKLSHFDLRSNQLGDVINTGLADVVDIQTQKKDPFTFIAADSTGFVQVFDIRNQTKPLTSIRCFSGSIVSFDLHQNAPYFVTLDSRNGVSAFNTDCELLSSQKYTSLQLLSHCRALGCLLHPHRSLVAVYDDFSNLSFLAKDREFKLHYDSCGL